MQLAIPLQANRLALTIIVVWVREKIAKETMTLLMMVSRFPLLITHLMPSIAFRSKTTDLSSISQTSVFIPLCYIGRSISFDYCVCRLQRLRSMSGTNYLLTSTNPVLTSNPHTSIVAPCFNTAAFLEQTLVSFLDKTYRNIAYITVDGGSTSLHEKHIS